MVRKKVKKKKKLIKEFSIPKSVFADECCFKKTSESFFSKNNDKIMTLFQNLKIYLDKNLKTDSQKMYFSVSSSKINFFQS